MWVQGWWPGHGHEAASGEPGTIPCSHQPSRQAPGSSSTLWSSPKGLSEARPAVKYLISGAPVDTACFPFFSCFLGGGGFLVGCSQCSTSKTSEACLPSSTGEGSTQHLAVLANLCGEFLVKFGKPQIPKAEGPGT